MRSTFKIRCQIPSMSVMTSVILFDYSARRQASAEYWIHFTAPFGSVHAFGCNSAECEPIWMKSGAL